MIVVTKPMDRAFIEALRGKPDEWKMRAVAGITSRECFGDDPRTHQWAKRHGLSRALSPSEREAWLFGWDWPDHALLRARAPLLDLLIGRIFRKRAEEALEVALDLERYGAPPEVVSDELSRAAHQEWVAVRSEHGQIGWGGRINRWSLSEAVVDAE